MCEEKVVLLEGCYMCLNKSAFRDNNPFIRMFSLNEHQVEPAVGAALLAWNFFMKEAHK